MKKLLRVRLHNFRSFQKEETFEFPDKPGLYYLTGENRVNPRLGANGAGKTTLWEALSWLWFEKTSRGLKAGDIAPWDLKGTPRVELDYEDGGVWTLGRTWSPNRWWLVDPQGNEELLTPDGSNQALAHLGMEFVPFLHCILMAQGQPMFLDMKPEAASSLFSQVMNLDHWLDASAKAGKMAATQDSETRALETKISRLQGQIDQLDDSGLRQSATEWEERRAKQLDELTESHARSMEKRRQLVKDIQVLEKVREEWRETVAVARQDLARCDDRAVGEGEARVRDKSTALALARRDLDDITRQATNIEKKDHCEHCAQDIPHSHKDQILGRLDESMMWAEDAVLDAKEDLEEEEKALLVLKEQYRDLSGALEKAKRELHFAEMDLRSVQNSKEQEEKNLDRIEEQAEDLERQTNPAEDSIRTVERRRKNLALDLKEAQAQILESESKHRLYSFWIKGFKDLRLTQISEALTQLEIEVNNCVAQLGLVGWSLLFDPDSETKAGKVKRGFSVKVLSPQNSKPVPWAAWSGGESQRLRIAGNMGMSNLIRDRLGITLPLEVWDEPTQGLSAAGVEDLLSSLTERAQSEKRQIWIVDHRSPGFGHFDGTVVVVKDSKGSRFEKPGRIDSQPRRTLR